MGMMDKIAAWAGFERRDLSDASWQALGSGYGYTTTISTRAAESLSAVLACTGVIATSLASIPANIYRIEGEGRVEAMTHPMRRIARVGVNDDMTWPDFVEHLVASMLLTGNGLAEILRAPNGLLQGFRFIPWHMVVVVRLRSGRLAYDVTLPEKATRRLLQGEVLHLRDRTEDGLLGRSRLSKAAETIGGVKAANDFARGFLDRGGFPAGVIESTATIPVDQKRLMRTAFEQMHSGPTKAGRVLITDGGLTYKQLQISPEDAELLETRKWGVEEICRLYQVPPPLVQDYSHNTFTNSETAGRWFAMFTLAPIARKIEAEFARSVFPSSGMFELELDLSGFLRGDPATRWNAHKIAIDTGVLDPDEVRQVEGWNPRRQEATVA